MITKINKFLVRVFTELKSGWTLSKLPVQVEKYEQKLYIKLIKFIGAICVFLIVSGTAQQYNKLTFYIIFIFSFIYSLYRLFIALWFIIQFIINLFNGKLIVRNSPVNVLNTILKGIGNVAKGTISFGVGTGMTYCLSYELDEILVQEGKEPYFLAGMRKMIKNMGAEEYAKLFLTKVGIKDRLDKTNLRSITDLLDSMSAEERQKYESETGQSWDEFYNSHKKIQENVFKSKIERNDSISKEIIDYVEKEDPFKTK